MSIQDYRPKDTKEIHYTFEEDESEITLYASRNCSMANLMVSSETWNTDFDEEAIEELERWAQQIAVERKLLEDYQLVDELIGYDWYSGMSLYNEDGDTTFTYEGFHLRIQLTAEQ